MSLLRRLLMCRTGWCGGTVERSSDGRICFRCATCGTESGHVSKERETRSIDRMLAEHVARTRQGAA